MHTKRFVFQTITLILVAAFVLTACGAKTVASNVTGPDVAAGYTGSVVSSVPANLVSACKAEGNFTIIATPPNWANYGEIFADFEDTTGVKINSLDPNAGSADELNAIVNNKGNKGPQAPDIVDVGYAYGGQGKAAGDFQPYKTSNWDKIPATLLGLPAKDADGYWIGGYYGVMAMGINTSVVQTVPKNWSDLLGSAYKGTVALMGPPTTSNQAVQAVIASGLANGGTLDNVQPGLDWFNKLNQAGNFVPVVAKSGTIASGATPIVFGWDYNLLGYRDTYAGNPPMSVIYPSPTIASMYVQAISAYAPHPNCAKVWMEVIQSDAGQLAWIKGYAHGVDQADMQSRGVIPAAVAAKLPTFDVSTASSPTPDQLAAAVKLIESGWMTTVGVAVPTPAP